MTKPNLSSTLSKVLVKYQSDAGNVLTTFVKPLRDGGENRSPGAANLRGFVFYQALLFVSAVFLIRLRTNSLEAVSSSLSF